MSNDLIKNAAKEIKFITANEGEWGGDSLDIYLDEVSAEIAEETNGDADEIRNQIVELIN